MPPETSGSSKSRAALPGGGIATGVGGTSGTNSPVVTLTAEPATVPVGGKSKLTWKVTKNPTSCEASEDWSGIKSSSGSETTQNLNSVQSYLFTLTCKNATGTGFATVSVGVASQSGTGGSSRPTVYLAANPPSIYRNDRSTLTWEVTNKPATCHASGDWSGSKPTVGPASTGKLTTVKTYKYTLTCKNSGGTGSATVTVKVINPPPGIPIVSMSANPVGPLAPGGSSKLSWTSSNASSCTASGDWSGSKTLSGSQSTGKLNAIKTYTFKLTCKTGNNSAFDNVDISILPKAPVVTLNVSPSSMVVGSKATIKWSVSNSPSICTASGDWSGSKSASGSESTGTLNDARTYLYSLSCSNDGGMGYVNNVKLVVSKPDAPTVNLTASPISINTGQSSTLSWTTSNASSCYASGDWSGSRGYSGGSQSTGTLNTVKTYSYTLTCSNSGGSTSATTSVAVSSGSSTTKPAVTLSVTPSTIGTGDSSTISWTVANDPTSCTASGSGGWSGSQGSSGSTSTGVKNSAGNYTYTLSCSNSAGSNSKTVTLSVVATPVISISVSPSTISQGSSATLSWSATNSPSSCTASGAWSGGKSSSGSQTVSPSGTGNYTYNLSCSNSGGSSSNSTVLAVSSASSCGSGGTCHLADIAPHNKQSDCWSAINASGSGLKAYKVTGTFITDHSSQKSASTVVSRLCGKVYTSNLRNKTSKHSNGATVKGLTYDQYISNFYIGPYN